ncbi:hypothetical protein N7486_010354 [Penicillium sp. IBT 16267x]|nr:hypothetical protein N7486_010354 [Penicillium sp. IBT 16267x]
MSSTLSWREKEREGEGDLVLLVYFLHSHSSFHTTCLFWPSANPASPASVHASQVTSFMFHSGTVLSFCQLRCTVDHIPQGRREEAGDRNLQVIRTCKTKFGKEDCNTLLSIASLALKYINQGRRGEAVKL